MTRTQGSQNMPRFFFRDPGDSNSIFPWAGISLSLPLYSDELHEALKKEYPSYGGMQQRLRKALADFLNAEVEGSGQGGFLSLATSENVGDNCTDSDNATVSDSESQGRRSSSCSSSDALSTDQHMPPVSRARQDPPVNAIPSQTYNPSQTEQMVVWDVKSGSNVIPKTRRKMSENERKGYKSKRAEGACSSCQRKKSKCTHPKDSASGSFPTQASCKSNKRKRLADSGPHPTKTFKVPKIEQTTGSNRSPGTRNDPPQAAPGSFPAEFSTHLSTPNFVFGQRSSQNDEAWDPQRGPSSPMNHRGYVNPPPRSLQNPTTDLQNSEWDPYTTPAGLNSFDPGYTNMDSSDPRDFSFPYIPDQTFPNADQSLSPRLQYTSQWPNQEGRIGNAEPG